MTGLCATRRSLPKPSARKRRCTARGIIASRCEREAEEAKKNEKERQQKDAERAAAGDIADARSRYAQALGSTYDIRDPYCSLANAAMVEYGSFNRQQDALRKEAAAEQDPDKRRLIELRREIEGHDYMAITSERLAGISRAITMGDNDGARHDDALAKTHADLAQEKRQERADPATRVARAREGRTRRDRTRRTWQRRAAGRSGTNTAVRPTRSQLEEAIAKAAGRHAAPTNERDDETARVAQREQESKKREGLRPDQPDETAPCRPRPRADCRSSKRRSTTPRARMRATLPKEPTRAADRKADRHEDAAEAGGGDRPAGRRFPSGDHGTKRAATATTERNPRAALRRELDRWCACRRFVYQFGLMAKPPVKKRNTGRGGRGAWTPRMWRPTPITPRKTWPCRREASSGYGRTRRSDRAAGQSLRRLGACRGRRHGGGRR